MQHLERLTAFTSGLVINPLESELQDDKKSNGKHNYKLQRQGSFQQRSGGLSSFDAGEQVEAQSSLKKRRVTDIEKEEKEKIHNEEEEELQSSDESESTQSTQEVEETVPQHANKVKKTIPEKLIDNLRLAQEQQERDTKHFLKLHVGEIPAAIPEHETKSYPIEAATLIVNNRAVGMAGCKGRRKTMEDRQIITEFVVEIDEKKYHFSVFGVFDGHGGIQSAEFVCNNLVEFLTAALIKHNISELTDEGIYLALRECFINLDEKCDDFKNGTTATVALIVNDLLMVANTGDSRTILNDNGRAIQMSQDAKLNEERFRRKVEKLGGSILVIDGALRVQGILNLGGSIGDRYIKGILGKCCLSPKPQMTSYSLTEIKGHLVLASDGYFDTASTNLTVEIIDQLANDAETSVDIAKRLVYSAVMSGSQDNVMMIVVPL